MPSDYTGDARLEGEHHEIIHGGNNHILLGTSRLSLSVSEILAKHPANLRLSFYFHFNGCEILIEADSSSTISIEFTVFPNKIEDTARFLQFFSLLFPHLQEM